MFVCFVVVGDYIKLPPTKISIPPLKVDHPSHVNIDSKNQVINPTDRFDSVQNSDGSHYIIYDPNKQYPGYLITYV